MWKNNLLDLKINFVFLSFNFLIKLKLQIFKKKPNKTYTAPPNVINQKSPSLKVSTYFQLFISSRISVINSKKNCAS